MGTVIGPIVVGFMVDRDSRGGLRMDGLNHVLCCWEKERKIRPRIRIKLGCSIAGEESVPPHDRRSARRKEASDDAVSSVVATR